jgi:hypothetical protein
VRNVTITLADEVARWARVRAAEQDKSLSRFLADILAAEMGRMTAYEEAKRSYLSQKPERLRKVVRKYPRREDLYDRPRLR